MEPTPTPRRKSGADTNFRQEAPEIHVSPQCTARRVRKNIPFETGLRLRMQAMLEERESLLEEVRQLRAAVQIYSAVAQRLQSDYRCAAPAAMPLRAA